MPGRTEDAVTLAAVAAWESTCPKELRISQQGLTDTGVASLVQMSKLNALETLDLSDNHHAIPYGRDQVLVSISGQGVQALVSSPFLSNLRVLNLGGNTIGVAGIRALIESTTLPALTCLDVSGRDWNKPTDWTNFHDNIGGDDGLELLLNSPWVSRLQMLNVSQNDFTTRGVSALIHSPFLTNLRCLSASTSKVDWKGDNTLSIEDQFALRKHFGERLSRRPFAC